MTKTEPLIDNRGTLIEVGSKVCYNLSGEIAMGIVQAVTAAKIGDYHRVESKALIKIKLEHPYRQSGKISKVRNPKNVMVVKEE